MTRAACEPGSRPALDRAADEPRILARLAQGPMSCGELADALDVNVQQLAPFLRTLFGQGKILPVTARGARAWAIGAPEGAWIPEQTGYGGLTYGPPAERGEHPADRAAAAHERAFVAHQRAAGRPWSAIAAMTGRYAPDLRRRYDPDWRETTP